MSSKRSKAHGVPVSAEEVLHELGNPASWSKDSRRLSLQQKLKRGQSDLDISGIRGYGQVEGYLDYLLKQLARPLGVDTGLVTPEKNDIIRKTVEAEITEEIEKYRKRLVVLEKSPLEVARHICDMLLWLEFVVKMGPQDPDKEDIDEMRKLAEESNAARLREIESLENDINKYMDLLVTLVGNLSAEMDRRPKK